MSMRWINTISLLLSGIWMGVIGFFGYGVAPTVIYFFDSRTQGTLLSGQVLDKMNNVEWFCALTLLGISALALKLQKSKWMILRLAISLMMVVSLFFYSHMIKTDMRALRDKIGNFDIEREKDARPERDAFDSLHKLYSAAVTINMIGLLVLASVITLRPAGKSND